MSGGIGADGVYIPPGIYPPLATRSDPRARDDALLRVWSDVYRRTANERWIPISACDPMLRLGGIAVEIGRTREGERS